MSHHQRPYPGRAGIPILASVLFVIGMMLSAVAPAATATHGDTTAHHNLQSTAVLQLTMRGCPEGVDPHTVDPVSNCTIPLDAPDVSVLTWDGGSAVSVPYTDRTWDGTYHVIVPANTPVSLNGFAPVLRDDFRAVGADGVNASGDPVITLSPGQTRHIGIYYYYYVPGSSAPGSSSQSSTEPGAPEGGASSVYIITSIVGWPFTSACYELVDVSGPVCSEMIRDMTYAAVFPDVPDGTYVVRQTADLDDSYVPDFTIKVTESEHEFWVDVVLSFGSPSRLGAPYLDHFGIEAIPYDSLAPGFYNLQANHVSVVFIDSSTRQKVVSDACVQIVGVTDVGCDAHRGQIDFLDVPAETHDVVVTRVPEGYVLSAGMEKLQITPIGRNPHAPVHIAYYIDVDPVSGNDNAIPSASSELLDSNSSLLTICASNRHGVDYPATIFNLPANEAIRLEMMVLNEAGELVPEWQGVRDGPCSYSSGFHLYEYVSTESAIVTYCENHETREAEAQSIGVEFVDIGKQGQSFIQGSIFVDWRSAPEGITAGSCSAPIGQTGEEVYEEMVGTWVGKRRSAIFNPDGTGVIQYNETSHYSYVVFDIRVDTESYPIVATIENVTSGGGADLAQYPTEGDPVILRFTPPGILVIELEPGWERSLCQSGQSSHFYSACEQ